MAESWRERMVLQLHVAGRRSIDVTCNEAARAVKCLPACACRGVGLAHPSRSNVSPMKKSRKHDARRWILQATVRWPLRTQRHGDTVWQSIRLVIEQDGYTNSRPCVHRLQKPPSPNHHGALVLPYHTWATYATAETLPIAILYITMSSPLQPSPPASPPHRTPFPSHPTLYHSSTPSPTAEERDTQDLPFSTDAALSLRCASASRSRLWRKNFSMSSCARVSLARRFSPSRRCMLVRSCC